MGAGCTAGETEAWKRTAAVHCPAASRWGSQGCRRGLGLRSLCVKGPVLDLSECSPPGRRRRRESTPVVGTSPSAVGAAVMMEGETLGLFLSAPAVPVHVWFSPTSAPLLDSLPDPGTPFPPFFYILLLLTFKPRAEDASSPLEPQLDGASDVPSPNLYSDSDLSIWVLLSSPTPPPSIFLV